MDEQIDSLKIQIGVDIAQGSKRKIDNLTSSLTALKAAAGDGEGLKTAASGFKTISDSLVKLSNINGLKDVVKPLTQLGDFFGTLKNVAADGEAFSLGIDRVKGSLSDMATVLRQFNKQAEGIGHAGASFRKLKNATGVLGDISVPEGAKANLDNLAVALKKASEVGPGLNQLRIGLKGLKESIESFSELKDSSKFEQVSQNLKTLSESVKGLDFKAGAGLKNISSAIKDLSKIGSGDIGELVNNLTNARIALEQFMKDLGRDVTDEEMNRFKELGAALHSVAEGYTKLTAARNAYSEAPKAAKDEYSAITGSITGSLGSLPIVGKFFGEVSSSAGSITSAFKAASAASGGLASALGPVAVGLAGVVAAIKGVQKYIEFINTEFDKIAKTLTNVASVVRDFSVGAFEAFKERLDTIGKTLSGFIAMVSKVIQTVTSFGSAISKSLDKIGADFFKNFTKNLKNVVNMVKRMALRKAINALFKDINDSFNNLVEFSRLKGTEFANSMDMFATSAKYLNNSIVAMVSPIINMVMPVFDKLIDKIVEICNAFNQLFSYFSGANEWTKAIKNAKKYGEEAEKSSKKQNKLKNAILSFDEIHKLNGDKGNGEGFEVADFEDWLFEIRNLDDLFDFLNKKLKGFVSNVKDYLDSIDWGKIKTIAYDLGEGIMKLLNTIFGDDSLANKLGKTLAEVINTAFSFALGAVEEWDAQAWGRSFVAFFEGIFDVIDWSLIRSVFEKFGTKLAQYFNTIFNSEKLFEDLGKNISEGFNSVLAGIANFVKEADIGQWGKSLGIAFRETFKNIDYDTLFLTFTTLLNKVFAGVSNWISQSRLPDIATKIGDSLTEGLKNIDWATIQNSVFSFARSISNSVEAILGNEELMSEAGKNLAEFIDTLKGAVWSYIEEIDPKKVGAGIGEFFDAFLENRNIEGIFKRMSELPQKMLTIIATAFGKVNTAELGKRIGIAITDAVKNINLDQIGADLGTIGTRIGEFLGNLFENVEFKDIGEKLSGLGKKIVAAVAKMMNEVDWAEVGRELAHGVNQLVFDFTEDEANLANASNIVDGINTFLESLLENVEWDALLDDISSFIEKLPLDKLWSSITQIAIRFWETKRGIVKAWFKEKISGIFDGIWEAINEKLDELDFGDMIWDAFMFVNPVTHFTQNPIAQEILSYLGLDNESLKKALEDAFKGLDFTDLKNLFGDYYNFDNWGRAMSELFSSVTNTVKELAGTIKNFLQPALDGVKNVFDTIKSAAKKIYNYIKNVIDEIEDSDLGDIVSSGSALLGGAAGYVSNKVKKHAKGMQGGTILSGATIFGMDGDTRLVGGEAGKEAVVGVGSLSTMIQSSVLGAMNPISMSTAVETGVRSAMQGSGTSPIVDVTLKCDSETLFKMVKQGQSAYNGRYHFVEDFA